MNLKVAMFFYEAGISFNVADTDKEMVSGLVTWARENKHVDYTPPSSYPLRTTLLDTCYKQVKEKIEVSVECSYSIVFSTY